MKKRQRAQFSLQNKPIEVKKQEDIELELSPGVLVWVLEQYSEDQKRGVTKWVLVGKK